MNKITTSILVLLLSFSAVSFAGTSSLVINDSTKQNAEAELELELAALFRKWSLQEIADFLKGLHDPNNFRIAEGVLIYVLTPVQLQNLYALMSASPEAYSSLPWSSSAMILFTAGNTTSSGNTSLVDTDIPAPTFRPYSKDSSL